MNHGPISKKKVLLIEDDQAICETIFELLLEENYDVNCVSNGLEALEHLETSAELPHLILLDLMMPILGGAQFRAKQISDSRISKIPVVVMSADTKVSEKSTNIAADDYLKKPIELDDLLNTVEKWSQIGSKNLD